MENRPQGLTIVGVVCVVVGTLSTCCNLWGLASTGMTVGLGGYLTSQGVDAQATQMMQMQREMALYTGIPALLGVIAALMLVAGGGLALSMRPAGRALLIGALAAAVLVAFSEAGIGAWATYRMRTLLWGGPGGGAGSFGENGMLIGMGVGMAAFWLAVKLAIYVPCLVYMLRGATAAVFTGRRQVGVRGE